MQSKYRLIISIIFLSVLAFLFTKLDLAAVYDQVLNSNKLFLGIGVSSLLLVVVLKIAKFTLISRYYFHPLTFKQASLVVIVGISIAMLTPGRVGEGSKVIIMNRQLGVPIIRSFSIVILERLTDIVVLGIGAFFFAFYILKEDRVVFLVGLLLVFLVIFLVVFLRYADVLTNVIPERYRGYFKDIKIKNDKSLLLAISILTVLVWTFETGMLWLVALSLGIYLPFYIVFGILCVSTITLLFSVLPAGIGTLDLSFLFLLSMVNVPIESGASILLIYRFFSISLPLLLSVFILNYYNLSLKDIKSKTKGSI